MNWNILIAKICRMPVSKVLKSIEESEDEIKKLQIMWGNQLLNKVEQRVNYRNSMSQEDILTALFSAKMLSGRNIRLEPMTFGAIKELNDMNPLIIAELTENLETQETLNMLNNFSTRLKSSIIQSLILSLPREKQKGVIQRFKTILLKDGVKDFVTFLGCLDIEMQKETLSIIQTEIDKLPNKDITQIIAFLHPENLQYMFDLSSNKIQAFNDEEFSSLLNELKGDTLTLSIKNFKDKFKTMPVEVMIFQLGLQIEDPHVIYEMLKQNPEKMKEVSDNYFHLILNRLTEEDCVDSLSTFKERYGKQPIEALLDLFGDSSNELKYKLFTEYENKIAELDNDTFLSFLNNNFTNAEYRKNLVALYSDRISSYDDENFIKFISEFHDQEYENDDREYYGSYNRTGKKEEKTIELIIDLFSERIEKISDENIPKLFSSSNSELGIWYVDILRNRLKQHITNRVNLSELISSIWGIEDFFEQFKTEFSTLRAEEWYKLQNSIRKPEQIKDFLETCNIDNLDFIDPKQYNLSYLKIFEKNLKGKVQAKFEAMSQKDLIVERFKMMVTALKYKPNNNVLLDQSYIEAFILGKILLSNSTISAKDEVYLTLKDLFINGLKANLVITDESYLDNISYGLFYRFLKGSLSIADLITIDNLKELLVVNRNPIISGEANDTVCTFRSRDLKEIIRSLSEEQCSKYNIKLFKRMCEVLNDKFAKHYPERKSIQYMAFKLFMAFGFEKGSKIIEKSDSFTYLEYLINDINILGIHLNEYGEPIVNDKLMNFLFGSNINDENININRILTKKVKGFEKIFADIYNNWYTLCQELNNDVSIKRIKKYFEDNQVALNPNEFELKPILVELGRDNQIIKKARNLYENMKKRTSSVIPKIKGNVKNYEYEILDLNDPRGLIVGYQTHCCFLINGQSASSLYHSAESRYGRIFAVKCEEKLVAQSWVWRNGNLICFDNVETTNRPDQELLLKVYTEAANSIMGISAKSEDDKDQVKLVTFGASYSDIEKPKKQVSEDNIVLPQEDKKRLNDSYSRDLYTDARTQYILAGNEEDNKYHGEVKVEYKDERMEPIEVTDTYSLSTDDKLSVRRKINSIDYSKNYAIREFNVEDYYYLNISNDWYIGITRNGEIELVFLDFDERAKDEVRGSLHYITERLNIELSNSKEIKEQAKELVMRCIK